MIQYEIDTSELEKQFKGSVYSEESILSALGEVAQKFCDTAKQNVDILDINDTGYLREHISVTEQPAPVSTNVYDTEVGSEAFYSGYVEYGTGPVGSSSGNTGPYPYTDHPWTYFNERWQKFVTTSGFRARPYIRNAEDQFIATDTMQKIFIKELKVKE